MAVEGALTDPGLPVQNASVNLTLTIAPLLTVTTTSLLNGVVGAAYSQSLTATGGTGAYSWQLTAGTLPGGTVSNEPGPSPPRPFEERRPGVSKP